MQNHTLHPFISTDYLKHLPEEHPDVVNTKGISLLMMHHAINVDFITVDIILLYTAALAVISETAFHMNSTIVDLVKFYLNAICCSAYTLLRIMICVHYRKGRRWC